MLPWNPSESLHSWGRLHGHLCFPGIPLNPFTLEEGCKGIYASLESLWIPSLLRKAAQVSMLPWNSSESLHSWGRLHRHLCFPRIPLNPFTLEEGCMGIYASLESLWIPSLLKKAARASMLPWNPSESLHSWGRLHGHLCFPGIPLNPFTLEEGCKGIYASLESLWIPSLLRKAAWASMLPWNPSESLHSWGRLQGHLCFPGIPLNPFTLEEGCTGIYASLESLWIPSLLRKAARPSILPWNPSESLHSWGRLHGHLCFPGIPLNPFTLEEGCKGIYASLESLWIPSLLWKAARASMLPWNPSESLHSWGRLQGHLCFPRIHLNPFTLEEGCKGIYASLEFLWIPSLLRRAARASMLP